MQQPKTKELNTAMRHLALAMGRQVGNGPGEWQLEFTGGGYRIKSLDKNGKLIYPLGSNSFGPREFLCGLFLAGQVITAYEQLRSEKL